MICMSGKAIATSSSSIGFEFCSRRPPPQRMPRADARVAAVEDRRQLVLGDHLVDRPGHPVGRLEALHRRVELEALDAVLLDQLARLARRPSCPCADRSLPKAIMMSRVRLRRLGDLLVRDAAAAHLRLGVDGEVDEADLLLAVVGDRLVHRRPLARAEVLVGGAVVLLAVAVERVAARHLEVGVRVDGDQVGGVHGETFGQQCAKAQLGPTL